MTTEPVTLEGPRVRLEPIRREHAAPLWEAARDAAADIFAWIPYRMATLEDFEAWTEKALADQARGESLVFVTVERSAGALLVATGALMFFNQFAALGFYLLKVFPALGRIG